MNLTTGLMIAQLLLNIGIAVAGWVALRRKATAEEIGKLRTSLEEMGKAQAETGKSQTVSCGNHIARTISLEEKIKSNLTSKALDTVYERVNQVKGSVDEMAGLLKGIAPQLKLLIEHHMKGGGQ